MRALISRIRMASRGSSRRRFVKSERRSVQVSVSSRASTYTLPFTAPKRAFCPTYSPGPTRRRSCSLPLSESWYTFSFPVATIMSTGSASGAYTVSPFLNCLRCTRDSTRSCSSACRWLKRGTSATQRCSIRISSLSVKNCGLTSCWGLAVGMLLDRVTRMELLASSG